MSIPTVWYENAGFPNGIASTSDFFKIIEFWTGIDPCVFRGESQEYETYLKPSIVRTGTFTRIEGTLISKEELVEVERCQKECVEKGISDPYLTAFLGSNPKQDDVNWLPLAQHLRTFKTRLVDMTYNPLVALYFASVHNQIKDGVIYFFSKGSLRPQKKNPDIGIDIPDHYQKLYDGDINDTRIADDLPYLLEPQLKNSNIIAQQGVFIWWKNPTTTPRSQLFTVKIQHKAKQNILNTLNVFGINEENLFPLK